MGYANNGKCWRHRNRQALFVGDLIDRGPQQLRTVQIVQAMVVNGAAKIVMGNHELNALAYVTKDPATPDKFLRPHTEHSRRQHEVFLNAVSYGSQLHQDVMAWFRTIPLWFDADGLRVVHACWDSPSIELLKKSIGDSAMLTPDLVAAKAGSDEHGALATVLKGPEIEISPPFLYPEGRRSITSRFAWWSATPTQLSSAALLPAGARLEDGTPYPALGDDKVTPPVEPYSDSVPVLFGHYWRRGTPATLTPQLACVDFVTNNRALVAYRWQGEATLGNGAFVSYGDKQ